MPRLASAIRGAKACATLAAPTRFTRRTRSQSAGSSSQNGNPSLPEPTAAAKTTWSHRPNSRWRSSAAARTASKSVASVTRPTHRTADASSSRRASAGPPESRSRIATRAPSARKAEAIASPSPRSSHDHGDVSGQLKFHRGRSKTGSGYWFQARRSASVRSRIATDSSNGISGLSNSPARIRRMASAASNWYPRPATCSVIVVPSREIAPSNGRPT